MKSGLEKMITREVARGWLGTTSTYLWETWRGSTRCSSPPYKRICGMKVMVEGLMGLYGVFFPLLLVKIVGEALRGVKEMFIYNICPSQVELY